MSSQECYYLVSRFPSDSAPKEIGFRPVGEGKVPEDYLAFRLDSERVIHTINAIFERDEEKRLGMYEQVYQAARVCFSGKEGDFASAVQALNEIKKNILNSSWIGVRNRIITVYGFFALVVILLLGVAQFFYSKDLYNLPLVLIGTCLGSWLFVSIKTSSITFDEVYESISQHRSLLIRLIYSCVLSLVVSLCLLAGFIEIKLGEVSTAMISGNGIIAISAGVFFGLGESSLASRLSDKVKDALS
ncbi:TPA: hypothetical protein ACSTJY_003067 [Serratia fonticola]